MVYLFVEDIKSGYDFWISVNKLIFNNKLQIYTSSGVRNMYNTLNLVNISSKDTVIMAFDTVNNTDVSNLLIDLKIHQKDIGYNLIISKLFCTEEIFVSSSCLIEWCEIRKYKEELEYIAECIHYNIDYIKCPNEKILNYIDNKGMGRNRERIVASILAEATNGTSFSTKNKSYSKCWHVDCCHYSNIYKTGCKLSDQHRWLDGEDKLVKLIKSSILPRKIPLDEIKKVLEGETYTMIYYKDILMRVQIDSACMTLPKVIELSLRKDFKSKKRDYGVDIFEQVYNYLSEQHNNDIKIGYKEKQGNIKDSKSGNIRSF